MFTLSIINKVPKIALFFILTFLITQCSGEVGGNSQFTQKLVAAPFVASVNGLKSKDLTLELDDIGHISWMGLDWTGNYKFFKIEKYTINGSVTTPETIDSGNIFKDINVLPSQIAPSVSGQTSTSSKSKISFRVRYSPSKAIAAEDKPHEAYLMIYTDKPKAGVISIRLTGFTKGICDPAAEDCAFVAPENVTPTKYKVVDSTLKMSVCHPEIASAGIANNPANPKIRIDPVTINNDFVFYISSDKKTVNILSNAESGSLPTVPNFDITIPRIPGVPDDVKELATKLVDPQNTVCAVDDNGGFDCDGVELSAGGGLTILSTFVVSTGKVSPTSTACADFGDVEGEGGINDDSMKIIAWGIIKNTALDKFKEALVVAEIPLEKVK